MTALDLNQLNISGIYKITNFVNNKVYIGSAINIRSRWAYHIRCLKRGSHCNSYLQRSWNLHGEQNFTITFLEECSKKDLLCREQYWLDILNPFKERGYNICRIAGSILGRKDSKETKLKKSKAAIGRKHLGSTKIKMSKLKFGKPSGFKGKTHSVETRQKMSRSNANTYKTHCKTGHEFTGENTYYSKNLSGNIRRSCKRCTLLRQGKRREARRENLHV